MEEKIKIESIVLNDKRKIMKELEEKRKTQEEVIIMLKILPKNQREDIIKKKKMWRRYIKY